MIAQSGQRRYLENMQWPETVQVHIEVARWSFTKHRPDGSVDFRSPIPSLFSYGSVPARMAADGDPEDALVVGVAPKRGAIVTYTIWGRVLFEDAGLEDHKWVVGPRIPTELQWAAVASFFTVYARAKRVLYLFRGISGPVHFHGVDRLNPNVG
jgi:inorganic pyrophosphatase|tara:strand:+ start:172 stop:633 length:462 start_codon:yes stop_codon:yes gene_type:complete